MATKIKTDGAIFPLFRAKQKGYGAETEACSVAATEQLMDRQTANDRPGMMLGQVQSGKTRAFMGVVALAFDNGFDVAIVLTKGTRALTRQTLARTKKDFEEAIARELLIAQDIQVMPDNLTDWDLQRKIVIVCKKEDDNIKKLKKVLTETYPALASKRLLIVDDEADFASVGFRRKGGKVESNVIPGQIKSIRETLSNAAFLQVTATPYSLYLQPESANIGGQHVFLPARPAFTEIVPTHGGYIGGEFYFEQSAIAGSLASFLHVPLDETELETLGKPGSIAIHGDLLSEPSIRGLRSAIVRFVVGAWIRRRHQAKTGEVPEHYSFIVHTHTKRSVHNWQAEVVDGLVTQLKDGATSAEVRSIVEAAHADLSQSLSLEALEVPSLAEVLAALPEALASVMVAVVNSERDIDELLDENGELSRRNPYNVFIGGQILDRGVTVGRMIGFYYGRNPKRSQQDTVLQHSRMYGNRERPDLAVTRFHTTPHIYGVMQTIHELDKALRASIAEGEPKGVVFLRADKKGRITPCAPNKILISDVVTLGGGGQLIPLGFSTKDNTPALTKEIDDLLAPYKDDVGTTLPIDVVAQVLELATHAMKSDPGFEVDGNVLKAALRHLDAENGDAATRGEVHTVIKRSGNYDKFRSGGRVQNYPLGSHDDDLLADGAGTRPRLYLLRQNGAIDKHWSGVPFWWPVLFAQPNARPVIYARRVAK